MTMGNLMSMMQAMLLGRTIQKEGKSETEWRDNLNSAMGAIPGGWTIASGSDD